MFHRQEQQQQKHRWIDLSSRMEYFSICIYLWYKEQQWLQDWDDHQIDLLHWKYRLQHRMQRRDKDPSNYLYRGRIVRRHLGLKWQFGPTGEPWPSGEDNPYGPGFFSWTYRERHWWRSEFQRILQKWFLLPLSSWKFLLIFSHDKKIWFSEIWKIFEVFNTGCFLGYCELKIHYWPKN